MNDVSVGFSVTDFEKKNIHKYTHRSLPICTLFLSFSLSLFLSFSLSLFLSFSFSLFLFFSFSLFLFFSFSLFLFFFFSFFLFFFFLFFFFFFSFFLFFFFFFNDTATTEIYTLSLHDALPIRPLRLGRRPA